MTKPLEPGSKAPAFTLPVDGTTEGDHKISLKQFAGKKVVLYFYPKDDTPGCTKQAIGFSAARETFEAANTIIIGVSKDSPAKHAKFRAKHDLCVTLASDEEGKVVEKYGVWVEKSMYGRKYMGIERATFLIDETGIIREIWRKVRVTGHCDKVLGAAQNL